MIPFRSEGVHRHYLGIRSQLTRRKVATVLLDDAKRLVVGTRRDGVSCGIERRDFGRERRERMSRTPRARETGCRTRAGCGRRHRGVGCKPRGGFRLAESGRPRERRRGARRHGRRRNVRTAPRSEPSRRQSATDEGTEQKPLGRATAYEPTCTIAPKGAAASQAAVVWIGDDGRWRTLDNAGGRAGDRRRRGGRRIRKGGSRWRRDARVFTQGDRGDHRKALHDLGAACGMELPRVGCAAIVLDLQGARKPALGFPNRHVHPPGDAQRLRALEEAAARADGSDELRFGRATGGRLVREADARFGQRRSGANDKPKGRGHRERERPKGDHDELIGGNGPHDHEKRTPHSEGAGVGTGWTLWTFGARLVGAWSSGRRRGPVMSLAARSYEMNDQAHWKTTITRFRKPTRKSR